MLEILCYSSNIQSKRKSLFRILGIVHFPVHSSAPGKAASAGCFHSGRRLLFWSAFYGFDGIGRVNHLTDTRRITEVMRKIFLFLPPRLKHHRVLLAPFRFQLVQRGFRRLFWYRPVCQRRMKSGSSTQVAEEPTVISPVAQMSKNRLPLNIILTTAAAWRLPAEPWVIPSPMCSLAGLMNFIPTDDVYLPVRPIRLRPLNQKSNVRLSWHSVHDKYQPVKSPGVLVSAVRYCINGKMKLSATVLTRLCVNITNLPWRL